MLKHCLMLSLVQEKHVGLGKYPPVLKLVYNCPTNIFQLLQDVEVFLSVYFESGHGSLNDPNWVKVVCLAFKKTVCIYLIPKRHSKPRQFFTIGLISNAGSFKAKACLAFDPHPSDSHNARFQKGESNMPQLQAPLVKEKRENLHLLLACSVYCLQGRSQAIAGQRGELWAGRGRQLRRNKYVCA